MFKRTVIIDGSFDHLKHIFERMDRKKEIIYDQKLCLSGLMVINSRCILDADKLIGQLIDANNRF